MSAQACSFVEEAVEVEEAFGVVVGRVRIFCDDDVAADGGCHAGRGEKRSEEHGDFCAEIEGVHSP